MSVLPPPVGGRWPLVSAAEMRALDHHTIEALGVPGDLLMESAGRAITEVVLAATAPGDEVVVVCGGGNNGGDGLVVARQLRALGVPVRVALLADQERLRGDAAANAARARALGIGFEGADWRAPDAGTLVDAVFGTGLSRDVTGAVAESLRRIEATRTASAGRVRVVSVDLPSGLCADTGAVLGCAVRADVTVTLGLPKRGLALEPGRSLAGRIVVARIGIADSAPETTPAAALWTRAEARRWLPERPAAGHKGSFGHTLVVAGSEGKTGAAALAAHAAGRIGAGLVTIACPAGLNDILEVKCTEAMTVPVTDTPRRSLDAAAEEAIVALAAQRDAVGLGPGIGRETETQTLVRGLAKRIDRPLVIDADGLFPFAGEPGLLRGRDHPTVLTPHPGEAATLLGSTAAAINRDRPGHALAIAEQTGAVVALKGAATVVAAPDGRLAINPTGGPALATGGTGDVLLGLVTGLLAQGVPAFEATTLAAFVHGDSADRLSRRFGDSGLLASDLLDELPACVASLRRGPDSPAPLGLSVRFPEP